MTAMAILLLHISLKIRKATTHLNLNMTRHFTRQCSAHQLHNLKAKLAGTLLRLLLQGVPSLLFQISPRSKKDSNKHMRLSNRSSCSKTVQCGQLCWKPSKMAVPVRVNLVSMSIFDVLK